MGFQAVKQKLQIRQVFSGALWGSPGGSVLVLLAVLSFVLSWAGVFPARAVEFWYARRIFPLISYGIGRIADATSFSWLDVVLTSGFAFVAWTIYRRRYRLVPGVLAAAYLVFFWSWGLNYHRQPLAAKLAVESSEDTKSRVEQFRIRAAREMNRLHAELAGSSYDEEQVRATAASRVGRVVQVIDGSAWTAASQIKTSRLANTWFRAAGVDGLFNPFGHEPIIKDGLLEMERPFVIAHELAHVRGYPNEGDANFIAVLATLVSDNPRLEYSGWLHLWFYLRNPSADAMLDDGPRRDFQHIIERMRSQQVPWVSILQAAVLDWYLKANSVEEGIRSYSQVVLLAVGTEGTWGRFK